MSIMEAEPGVRTATRVADALRQASTEPVASISDASVVDEVHQWETIARLAYAQQARLIAEAEQRGLPSQSGARNTVVWLTRMLRVSPGEAKTRAVVSRRVEDDRLSPNGQPLPSELPTTAELLARGAIGLDHARAIADGLDTLPPDVEPADREEIERTLAEHAHNLDASKLRLLARRIRYHYDQDGTLRDEQHQHQRRELHIGRSHDGMTVLKGRLDRETGAKLCAALQPLAAPRPAADGERDPRSAGARNADALDALVDAALAGDQLPTSGGQRPHLSVTIDYETLRAGLDDTVAGSGTLDATGEPLSASAARRFACDAKIIPIVLGARSEPLDVGRLSYVVPTTMRQALLVRDGQCAMPDCDRPPGTSQIHHARHWIDGGETKVDNLVVLCAADHRRVHAEGWHVRIHQGRPEFMPPPWIDPTQTPRSGQGRDPTTPVPRE